MFVAQRAQRLLELDGRGVEAAFALHRLDHDRGDVARRDVDLEERVEPRERVR